MRLHHFTNCWPAINLSGHLRTGWPPHNIVHFTSSDDSNSLTFGLRDRRYRITVDVPVREAHQWIPWAHDHLRPEEIGTLTATGRGAIPTANDGPPARPDEWYVVERVVPRSEWLWAADLHAGAIVWHATGPS